MALDSKLTIMQCAGASLAIRPDLKYAGTERIAYQLNEAFSNMGHETIMVAPANSNLNGNGTLLPTFKRSLWRRDGAEREIISRDRYEMEHATHYRICLDFLASNNVDVLHDHPGSGIVASESYLENRNNIDVPIITTIHNVFDSQKSKHDVWRDLRKEGRPIYFNAISQSHKSIYERETGVEIDKVILHGVPLELYDFQQKKQPYLFWIGTLSSKKGTDLAVKVAQETGRPLVLAGEVHSTNKQFYEEKVGPHVTRSINKGSEEEQELEREKLIDDLNEGREIVRPGEVLYVGPVDDRQKAVFFRNSYAMLMPNRWEEPFGLTLIESMASGTPVIGTNLGSLPEIIYDGKTGFIVDPEWNSGGDKRSMNEEGTIERMAQSVEKIGSIENVAANCRTHVEENFDRMRMAEDYIGFYREIISNGVQT